MNIFRGSGLTCILLSLAGPLLALAVTWVPVVNVSSVRSGPLPEAALAESLRSVPTQEVLEEIGAMAIGVGSLKVSSPDIAVAEAERALQGLVEIDGALRPVSVPFVVNKDLYELDVWRLSLCGFEVPRTLVLGYAASGDERFLSAAMRYILDWSRFEAIQLVPRGYVLNDHATASRALVVTEVWRLYRDSALYRPGEARKLLSYVEMLMHRLGQDRLYEYRTNHGLMQTLSLLHLTTAFPLLPGAATHSEAAEQRLLSQLEYFISPEGVILEHSPGYQQMFLGGLSAAWRYLALRNTPVPVELAKRYQRAVEFTAALTRPDGTLPPIGDTHDGPYPPVRMAVIDPTTGVAASLAAPFALPPPASDVTLAPASGWAVFWTGLEGWPNSSRMTQTVVHWADFPSRVHKHPDEMGISIWAGGHQWVRSIGYWPFDESRKAALDWRSSNAPHWLGEASLRERRVMLLARSDRANSHFLDLERSGPNGSRLRRQVLVTKGSQWAVIDNFRAADGAKGEIVWRFAPDLALVGDRTTGFRLIAEDHRDSLEVNFSGYGDWAVEADTDGDADWNSGLQSNGRLLRTPAIRILADGGDAAVMSLFAWRQDRVPPRLQTAARIEWRREDAWSIVGVTNASGSDHWERQGMRLLSRDPQGVVTEHDLSAVDDRASRQAMQGVIEAYRRAEIRYGLPFSPMLERRNKVTVVILACALLQIVGLLGLPSRLRHWRGSLSLLSVPAWCALAVFLRWSFLV